MMFIFFFSTLGWETLQIFVLALCGLIVADVGLEQVMELLYKKRK